MLSSSISHMCWRPIQKSPAGINAMSADGLCARSGSAATITNNTPAATYQMAAGARSLFEERCDFIVADEFRAAERSGLHVFVNAAGRRIFELLRPIDAESRINAANNVVHVGLL